MAGREYRAERERRLCPAFSAWIAQAGLFVIKSVSIPDGRQIRDAGI